jgi:hypothetical protein
LLEADLDGDEKVRTKLETTVADCALTRDNFAKAIIAQEAKIEAGSPRSMASSPSARSSAAA